MGAFNFSLLVGCLVARAMGSSWAKLPQECTLDIESTQLKFPSEAIDTLEQDLKRPFRLPLTYENTRGDERYGVTLNWMEDAVRQWGTTFDISQLEDDMNRHPNFIVSNMQVANGSYIDVHFMALFSQKPDAIPIALFHGWPGSFMEFIDLLDVVKQRYNPQTSPYHLIAPSLPGFAFTSGPPVHVDWGTEDTASLMDELLIGLGFGDGYIAQGGDIGSFVARTLGLTSESCKGVHLNFIPSMQPESVPDPEDDPTLTEQDRDVLDRSMEFVMTQQAYAIQQGTRPSTVGMVLANNPIGLLAWVGEKFRSWTDPSDRLSLDQILSFVSLYHLTETISRSLYSYRETSYSISPEPMEPPYLDKPLGYSRFPYDNSGVPESWAETLGNLTFYKAHTKGGHFGALEQPAGLWDDIEEFIEGAFGSGDDFSF